MKLSIIIPMYNAEKYISNCLESLINQDLKINEYEIIVIDDGSNDNSVSIVNQYALNYTNINVHNQENKGVGAARNYGIRLAKGKYIYFIDADDYLAAKVLKTIVNYGDSNKVDVLTFMSLSTTMCNLDKSNTDIQKSFILEINNGIDYIAKSGFKNEIWWYIINTKFLRESGNMFIEGRWMEDAIFTAKLLIKANKVSYLPLDAHRHVKVPESAMTNREPSHYLKVIYDNENAATVYASIIENLQSKNYVNKNCLKRLKARQQSFVFFLLIRILKSSIKLRNVKTIMRNMEEINAYPLNSFIGEDYNRNIYIFLVKLFNNKYIYYSLFLICNQFFKLKNKISYS